MFVNQTQTENNFRRSSRATVSLILPTPLYMHLLYISALMNWLVYICSNVVIIVSSLRML